MWSAGGGGGVRALHLKHCVSHHNREFRVETAARPERKETRLQLTIELASKPSNCDGRKSAVLSGCVNCNTPDCVSVNTKYYRMRVMKHAILYMIT